jgi:hypothetical protein
MQNYKFLNYIVLWNVFFAIICIPTAGKLIDVMGIPISISIYYFPFVYIFTDIMTEVYGYAVARRVLWYCILLNLVAKGKAHGRNSQGFKPDLGNSAVRHYRGASENVAMVEMRSQLAIERAGLVTPHLQPARRSSIPTIDRRSKRVMASLEKSRNSLQTGGWRRASFHASL